MHDETVKAILVPGAWMAAWIWEPIAERLRKRGFPVETITLHGLEPSRTEDAIAAVRLEDHVEQLIHCVRGCDDRRTVLVSHSYSAMPAALAADRLRGQVRGLIHFGGFLPVDGRSLLDDWGASQRDREHERSDIAAAGDLWLPPERGMLDGEIDLDPEDRDLLVERFTPHPGRTVTDPARISAPVEAQPTTFVALSPHGGPEEAWRHAPPTAKDARGWRKRALQSGHWPMLSMPDAVTDLIADEIRFYSAEQA